MSGWAWASGPRSVRPAAGARARSSAPPAPRARRIGGRAVRGVRCRTGRGRGVAGLPVVPVRARGPRVRGRRSGAGSRCCRRTAARGRRVHGPALAGRHRARVLRPSARDGTGGGVRRGLLGTTRRLPYVIGGAVVPAARLHRQLRQAQRPRRQDQATHGEQHRTAASAVVAPGTPTGTATGSGRDGSARSVRRVRRGPEGVGAGGAKGPSASAGVPHPAQARAPLRCRRHGWQ